MRDDKELRERIAQLIAEERRAPLAEDPEEMADRILALLPDSNGRRIEELEAALREIRSLTPMHGPRASELWERHALADAINAVVCRVLSGAAAPATLPEGACPTCGGYSAECERGKHGEQPHYFGFCWACIKEAEKGPFTPASEFFASLREKLGAAPEKERQPPLVGMMEHELENPEARTAVDWVNNQVGASHSRER